MFQHCTPMGVSMILIASTMFLPGFLVSMYASMEEERERRRTSDRIITIGTHIGIGGLIGLLLFTASAILALMHIAHMTPPYSSLKAFGVLCATGAGSAMVSWGAARLVLLLIISVGPPVARFLDGLPEDRHKPR